MSQVLQFECMSMFFSAIPLTCYTGRLDWYEEVVRIYRNIQNPEEQNQRLF